jgi:hypothetical protein
MQQECYGRLKFISCTVLQSTYAQLFGCEPLSPSSSSGFGKIAWQVVSKPLSGMA